MHHFPSALSLPVMRLYATAVSYGQPWIDKVVSLITQQVSKENRDISDRLNDLESALIDDFAKADTCLKDLSERLTVSNKQIQDLQDQLKNAETVQARTQAQIASYQQKLVEKRSSLPLPVNVEIYQKDQQQLLLQMKAYVSAVEEKVSELGTTFEPRISKLETDNKTSEDQKIQDNTDRERTHANDLVDLIDRIGKLDVRLTALEGDCVNEKLIRQNSKLKRKSFLNISGSR